MSGASPISHVSAHVAQIVSAYVANHTVEAAALPDIIRSVQSTLGRLSAGGQAPLIEDKPQPAVPIKRSVFPDFIICLEDGRKLKSLKRHLHAAYGLTPEQYRERWGLPPTYPMVAPNYSLQRSGLAKKSGLGRLKPAEPAVIEMTGSDAPLVRKIKAGIRGKKVSSAAATATA
jgi:predicted transcriptional regulator